MRDGESVWVGVRERSEGDGVAHSCHCATEVYKASATLLHIRIWFNLFWALCERLSTLSGFWLSNLCQQLACHVKTGRLKSNVYLSCSSSGGVITDAGAVESDFMSAHTWRTAWTDNQRELSHSSEIQHLHETAPVAPSLSKNSGQWTQFIDFILRLVRHGPLFLRISSYTRA